ncbi:RNA polymerase sigma factor [Limnoglobus roseus]|uniref:RNA polymerase sigma factor n=1 Tax=Limnoglobus roseus TaxID=2598579 RepID=A0A5C1AED9_9BACT|nr:sigma-70 family RNA polymerase sigma factor [Limnoglobus roseus]QEL16092.1 RNA polymerase sigma factor [Limnoglobus roseus]
MTEAQDNWREQGFRSAALTGDAVAWRALYDGAFEAVAGYVHWRAGGLADLADDVIQEAWLTAARKLSAFDPGQCRFAAWVCGIAGNVLRHHLRSRTRYRRRVQALGPADPPAPTADHKREQAEQIAVALANLPDRYEQALRAKYFDRLSVEQIAAAWGESPKAVESLLSRARQAFREEFEKHQ